MLDELLRQLQEAAEQKQNTGLPGVPTSTPVRPSTTVDEAQRRFRETRRRAEEQRKAAEAEHLASIQAEETGDIGESQTRRTVADAAIETSSAGHGEHPLLARLRAPGGLRDAVVLSEILRRPGQRRR